ncbi:COG1525 Micrococcal nuclease (thermonuclease) homologs [Caulobacteraceae bacterium]
MAVRSRNRAFGAVALIMLFAGQASGQNQPPPKAEMPQPGSSFSCEVTGVHDGDGPIYCTSGVKIRLSAVAARELDGTCSAGHPCPAASAEDATEALKRLVLGQVLQCRATNKTYDRIAAWCWRSDGKEVNCEMVRSGTALHWVKYDPEMLICGGGTSDN